MSGSLLLLCLAAFALIAALSSAALAATLPWLDRAVASLAPRQRVWAWLCVAALPAVIGAVTVLSTLLPALGFGVDHCLAHDAHHPHICPHHLQVVPGAGLIAIAVFIALRALAGFVRVCRTSWLSRATSRTLAHGSCRHDDEVLIFASSEPQAFVLGTFTPRIHASTALLDMRAEIVAPVLAHERAHARGRDPLWRALLPLLAAAHLPLVVARLARRLTAAQELAADADAAHELGDGGRVAEALLSLARRRVRPCPGLSFTHGDVAARVRALLEPPLIRRSWPAMLVFALLCAALGAISLLPEAVHHAVETLLGTFG